MHTLLASYVPATDVPESDMTRVPLLLLMPAALLGCAESALQKDASDEAGGAWDTGGDGAPSGDDGADDDDTAPSEEESDYLRLAPAATDAYVFVANPTRDTVTRIAVPSLEVLTAKVGETPSVVDTTADYRRAVTLNEGSDTVSIIDAETLEVTEVEIRDNFNSLSLSGDGAWVMAWYDPERESLGSSGGVQSYNEVSFVDLETGTHWPMAVGFDPHGVKWSPDGRLALVVSDASLAVVDLTAATPAPRLVTIADSSTDAPEAEEVELSPDGGYAFVRQFGADEVLVVDLVAYTVGAVPVGANPTDLDLSPDGTKVAVVARGDRQLWLLDAADPFGDTEVFDLDTAYGSVLYAGDGAQAILYTNATALASFAVWDTAAGTITEHDLVKPVQSMGVSPTGGSLLVFHTKGNAEGADTTSPFYDEWALTLIDLGSLRQNPLLLPAEPTSYAVSDDGRFGFFTMDGEDLLETLLFDSLLYEEVELPSEPVYLGVLPDTDIAYASQEHDLGRISFYDAATDALDTITGFELNSDIDH